MNWIKSLGAKIAGVSSQAWSFFQNYILPVLASETGRFIQAVTVAAVPLVIDAATRGGSGSEKKEWVRTEVTKVLIAQGTISANNLLENWILDQGIQNALSKAIVKGQIDP